jgi:Polyketide cyclase / dehydrase and lipid transport
MARYTTTIRTPWTVEKAFDYLADVRNFDDWDPGTERSTQVVGTGPGPDAEYDLVVKTGPTSMTMHYEVVEFDHPRAIRLTAKTPVLSSLDEITVGPSTATGGGAGSGGAEVTYSATLTLAGPLVLADPLLSMLFRGVGDRAAEGLCEALDGTIVGS